MRITKKIQDAINKQINAEFFSAYQYLSMSAYFEEQNLKGFAHWMKIQADEEVKHALKLYEYVIARGGRVLLAKIDAPQTEWKNALAVSEHAYKHEEKVTEMINYLVEVAKNEKDNATNVFLHWFVTEQVEEEDNARELLDQVKLAADSGHGLFILDRELISRKAE